MKTTQLLVPVSSRWKNFS